MPMALFLILLVSCTRNDSAELAKLQTEVSKLKVDLEAAKPGLGEIMGTIQQHHEKLFFAGENENFPLAKYELGEIKENLDRATEIYAHFKEVKAPLNELRHITDPPMEAIKQAIDRSDKVKFLSEFKSLTSSCNTCHQAAERGFVVIQVPQSLSITNQKFSK